MNIMKRNYEHSLRPVSQQRFYRPSVRLVHLTVIRSCVSGLNDRYIIIFQIFYVYTCMYVCMYKSFHTILAAHEKRGHEGKLLQTFLFQNGEV